MVMGWESIMGMDPHGIHTALGIVVRMDVILVGEKAALHHPYLIAVINHLVNHAHKKSDILIHLFLTCPILIQWVA